MQLHLTPTHLDTLVQLMDIAKKHDCYIYISVGDSNSYSQGEAERAIWEYLIDRRKITEELSNEISEYIVTQDAYYLHDYVCFELVEKLPDGKRVYHHMTYNVYKMFLTYEETSYDRTFNSLSPKAEDWLMKEGGGYDDCRMISVDTSETVVHGFPGVETKVNVYREGMAMKNFGDLVCDYLHEPRIEKVY